MLITISEFIGHLHPVLVHLPIGILMIACLLQWLSSKPRFRSLDQAITITLLCGMLSAIAAGVSGFLLSSTDDYDEQLVNTHQWLGIFTTIASVIFYLLHKKNASALARNSVSIILFLLIVVTGHFGGSLTHGSDYLAVTGSGETGDIAHKPIPNVQEAVLYTDIVQPLLQSKCYGCHGRNKQKGGLRMDDSARLFKGGKDGIVLIAGKADESELMKRGLPYRINRLGSMISVHYAGHDIVDFESASRANIPLFNKLFHHMLDNGVYLPPSAYESWFLNNALSYADLDKTIAVFASFEHN